jgi:phenylpropionate dioxygenase-like ring-hydroxylating dioxygenase large terminal subunit
VAYATEVGAVPRAATLLEEPLALWRDSRGAVRAFQDLCLHRGTALSLGTIHGD